MFIKISKFRKKFSKIFLTCLLLGLLLIPSGSLAATVEGQTYVIPISGNIDNRMLSFVRQSYTEAISSGATAIIFEIDTYGGRLDDAIAIKELILNGQVPTVCFVNSKAISAGALLALSGEQLAMRPGSVIGAAEPREGNKKADQKVLSVWTAELTTTAEARGKNGTIAAAFADSDLVIEKVTEKGKLLTLSDMQALELGMADFRAVNTQEVAQEMGFSLELTTIDKNFKERATNLFSMPWLAAVLLTIGIAGIVIELITTGFGIFGVVGILAMILFFSGSISAGYAGPSVVFLFSAGVILLMIEVFAIPGFGVTGVLGIAMLIASIIYAAPSVTYGIVFTVVSFAGSGILIYFASKNKRSRRFLKKLVLSQKLDSEEGYDSADQGLRGLIGQEGVTISPLRPAGTGLFADKRIDIVTEGDFIDKDVKVKVIDVEGVRVIVREINE
ncbi:MAG: NfeD family protein [Bacillota bacterium]|jgi:membrane-bound serine protease (ClpP class)